MPVLLLTPLRSAAACLFIVASVASHVAVGDESPKKIAPEDARSHVGTVCTVTFKVRHTKHGVNRKTYFLDSLEDFRSEKNLGVQISEATAEKLKTEKNVTSPDVHYADKTIRVAGKVFLQEGRAYIAVEKVDQIDVVDDAK